MINLKLISSISGFDPQLPKFDNEGNLLVFILQRKIDFSNLTVIWNGNFFIKCKF